MKQIVASSIVVSLALFGPFLVNGALARCACQPGEKLDGSSKVHSPVVAAVKGQPRGKALSPGGVDLIIQSRSLSEGLEFERKPGMKKPAVCQWLPGHIGNWCRNLAKRDG